MALKVPNSSLQRRILIAAVCALTCACFQATVVLAQRGQQGQKGQQAGHVGGGHAGASARPGGGQVSAPHIPPAAAPHATTPRPLMAVGQRLGFGQRVGLGPPPIFFRGPIFHRAPFFPLRRTFYPYWWVNCGPAWALDFGCGWRAPEYPVENYLAPPLVIYEPEYVYYGGERDLVLLFLKDGTVYGVTDYWFVRDKIHFTVLEDGGTKAVELVIGVDELDLQKTIDVNTRRGFRLVRRDEPLEQYLRDHPEANPPLLAPSPKN
jgi:hypothetical protein